MPLVRVQSPFWSRYSFPINIMFLPSQRWNIVVSRLDHQTMHFYYTLCVSLPKWVDEYCFAKPRQYLLILQVSRYLLILIYQVGRYCLLILHGSVGYLMEKRSLKWFMSSPRQVGIVPGSHRTEDILFVLPAGWDALVALPVYKYQPTGHTTLLRH